MKRKLLALFICALIFFIYLILMVPFRTPGGTPGGTPGILILTMVLWFTWRFVDKKSGDTLSSAQQDKLPMTLFVLFGAAILYGIVIIYAGFVGIEAYAGAPGWAWTVLVIGLLFRFTLPLTVGAFYAAHNLWHWHWALALVFAAPGIAFNLLMVPGVLASLLANDRVAKDEISIESDEEKRLSNTASAGCLLGYELLAAEKQRGDRHESLWLKCFSEADGDELKAEHAYNRERATMLGEESRLVSETSILGAGSVKELDTPTRVSRTPLFIVLAVCVLLFAGVAVLLKKQNDAQEAARSSEKAAPPRAVPNETIQPIVSQLAHDKAGQNSGQNQMPESRKTVEAPKTSVEPVSSFEATNSFTNSLGMKFVKIPETDVLMCIHETRNVDYANFASSQTSVNPEWQTYSGGGKDQHPVVKVNYEDATSFCRWLSVKEGRSYRLPTDEEWSAAVGKTKFPWGDYYPPLSGDGNYGLSGSEDGYAGTAPVMSYKANLLGIYDLGGNVWEWCQDESNSILKIKVLRGASWSDVFNEDLLSLARTKLESGFRGEFRGFRIVLPAVEALKSTVPAADSLDQTNKIFQSKYNEIFQERIQTARQKGLDIRNVEVILALTRARFLELYSPQRGILDKAFADAHDYFERKKADDEKILERVRKWISDEEWASKQRSEYIKSNPDYKPPVITDNRCDPSVLDSWILHKKDDLLFFWGEPTKIVSKDDGGELLGYLRDGNLFEVFSTSKDGYITYWETVSGGEQNGTAGPVGDQEEVKIDFPKPMFIGTPIPAQIPNLEKPDPSKIIKTFLAPKGTVNLAKGKAVTSSDPAPIIGDLTLVTDGDADGSDGCFVELAPGPQWVQIDLGATTSLSKVAVWHYHKQAQAYFDVVVQLSDDPEFKNGVTIIWNSDQDDTLKLGAGSDLAYIETNHGRVIDAKGIKARYVRLTSNGNTSNEMNHYCEIQVFGVPGK